MHFHLMSILAVLAVLASPAFAAEQVDNPLYTAWAKFKPGTTVTSRSEDITNGVTTVTLNKTTLTQVAPDNLVLEVDTTASRNGRTITAPTTQLKIPAKQDKPAAPASAPAASNVLKKESIEEIDVAGTTVKAKVVESSSTVNGITTISKIWTSDELPDHTLKLDMTSEGPNTKSSLKITIVEMTIK